MTFAGSSVTMRKSSIATTFDGLPRLRATTQYYWFVLCVSFVLSVLALDIIPNALSKFDEGRRVRPNCNAT